MKNAKTDLLGTSKCLGSKKCWDKNPGGQNLGGCRNRTEYVSYGKARTPFGVRDINLYSTI